MLVDGKADGDSVGDIEDVTVMMVMAMDDCV